MIDYTIHKTRKGECVVRVNNNTRDVGHFSTEPEAQAFIDERRRIEVTEANRAAESRAAQSAFDNGLPDLNRLQIRWQNWRNWFYNEMMHSFRHAEQHERALDMAPNQSSPSFHKQQGYLAQEQTENANANDLYYGAIAQMDARIKSARRAHDDEALSAALGDAESLVEQMDGFFSSVARPEEYKRPVGRPPAAGTQRQERISATIPPEYKRWLEAHGDISEQIRALIERAMRQ